MISLNIVANNVILNNICDEICSQLHVFMSHMMSLYDLGNSYLSCMTLGHNCKVGTGIAE